MTKSKAKLEPRIPVRVIDDTGEFFKMDWWEPKDKAVFDQAKDLLGDTSLEFVAQAYDNDAFLSLEKKDGSDVVVMVTCANNDEVHAGMIELVSEAVDQTNAKVKWS